MAKLTGEAKKKFLARMAKGRKKASGGKKAKSKSKAKTTKAKSKRKSSGGGSSIKALAARVNKIDARLDTVEHNDAVNQHLWSTGLRTTPKEIGFQMQRHAGYRGRGKKIAAPSYRQLGG